MEAMLQRQRPEPPSRLITQQPFLFARMFVFALDHLGRALGALAKTSGAPQGLKATYRAFMDQFPGLKGTRDSEHHRDERQMGLARGKPIRPHAVKIPGAVTAPAGAIILVGNLVGTKLTCTSEFGDVVEVDVSLASLKKVEKMVQDALNLFQWKGQPVQLP
jgi:hypothetical protein